MLGVILLCQTVLAISGSNMSHCGHQHGKQSRNADHLPTFLAVVSGAIPCSGSLLVFTYAIGNRLYVAGMLLVLAIGLGMAVATSAIGIIARYTRQRFLKYAKEATLRRTRLAFAFAGALVVILAGLVLFATTLRAV